MTVVSLETQITEMRIGYEDRIAKLKADHSAETAVLVNDIKELEKLYRVQVGELEIKHKYEINEVMRIQVIDHSELKRRYDETVIQNTQLLASAQKSASDDVNTLKHAIVELNAKLVTQRSISN